MCILQVKRSALLGLTTTPFLDNQHLGVEVVLNLFDVVTTIPVNIVSIVVSVPGNLRKVLKKLSVNKGLYRHCPCGVELITLSGIARVGFSGSAGTSIRLLPVILATLPLMWRVWSFSRRLTLPAVVG